MKKLRNLLNKFWRRPDLDSAIGFSTPYIEPDTSRQDWFNTQSQFRFQTGQSPITTTGNITVGAPWVFPGQVVHSSVVLATSSWPNNYIYMGGSGGSGAALQNVGSMANQQGLQNMAYDPAYDPSVFGNEQSANIRNQLRQS